MKSKLIPASWPGALSGARCGLRLLSGMLAVLPLAGQEPPASAIPPAAAKPTAHGIPFCEVAPAIAVQAKEALSGFAKSVLYLGPADPADPSILRAIYQDFEGEFWLIELIWKEKESFLDIGDVTAESLGRDRAEAVALIDSWKAKPAAKPDEE